MAKRKYGEGSIRQRKDGRWEGRVVIAYDEKGFPKAKSVLAKSKWECQQKLEKLKQELKAPIEKLTDDISFGDWMDFWFREFATPRLKESTRETYGYRIYKQIIPRLGHIPLKELKQADLQGFYASLKKEGRLIRTEQYGEGLSDAHIRSIHAHCKEALDKAVEQGLIYVNPAKNCKLPPKRSREMQILTKEEMQRLLIQAKEEGFYEMFLLDISTGLRRGELLALKWDDVDFNMGEIRISRQVNKVEDKLVISEPKTKSSVRTIVLSAPVLKMLQQYKESVKSEWLFPSPINPDLPREPSACRKKLTQILEHANCKHVRFHDLRHTFATMAIENGIDIKTVAALLGHNTVATSINTYTHTTDEMRRAAASNIDRKIGGVEPSSDIRVSEQPSAETAPKAKFEAYKGKKRKPGTGYVKQLSPNCWQGRYTPTVNGKRTSYNIYAPTEAECEEKLAELIKSIREGREQNIG